MMNATNNLPIVELKCDIQNALSEFLRDREKLFKEEASKIEVRGHSLAEVHTKYAIKALELENQMRIETYATLISAKQLLKTLGIDVDKYKEEGRLH